MPVSSSTEHWIKPDALTINLNHFGDPDYLQVSVLAGAVVMAFKQDVIGYNAAHNYRTWPLEVANTYLETTSAYNVYARLTRSEVNARALVVYDTVLRDIEGREITYAEDGSEVLGDANSDYFFVFLGQISASVNSNGESVQREWIADFRFGSLETNQQKNDYYGAFEKMFRPHYDDPLNPGRITWIEALSHLGVVGGVTMYVDNGKIDLPSIYAGLPIDGKTIYWDNGVLKALYSPGGGEADSVEWNNIKGIPSWITNTKPKYDYSEIEGTPDLSKYALVSQIPSLDGYATESWVTNKGYATQSWVLGKGYATLSDVDVRIDALINGAPSAFDTLKEIADVLQGNVNSIGDIITALGSKAEKATTLSGYGITDAYTKTAVNDLLKGYVTIVGTEDVTGLHNFVNGLKVGGIKLYKSQDDVIYIDGNLAVRGGVTMYADDGSVNVGTIYDGLPIDGSTIYWDNGILKAVGGGGVADSVAWADITGKPSFATVATSGSYNDLLNKPTLLSSFTNDLGFVTSSDIPSTYNWSDITSKPTTLSGYGITDGAKAATSYAGTSLDDVLSYAADNQTFIGSVVADKWRNIISVRHRNGSGDGKSYGMLLYTSLTGDSSLNYRQHIDGKWKGERTLLDSWNYLGYTYSQSTIDSKLSGYLPLSGGTITISSYQGMVLKHSTTSAYPLLWFANGGGNIGAIGVDTNKNIVFDNGTSAYTILHSNNYTSYTYSQSTIDSKLSGYLPLSGGTIIGGSGVYTPLIVKNSSSEVWIQFQDSVGSAHIGTNKGVPSIYLGSGSNMPILHSGNIGSYNAGGIIGALWSAKTTPNLLTTWHDWGNEAEIGYGPYSYGIYSVSRDVNYQFLLGASAVKDGLFLKRRTSDGWGDWKTISFTDSDITGNAATATKLATARTIWGQSFDGTGNISGNLSSVGIIQFSNEKSFKIRYNGFYPTSNSEDYWWGVSRYDTNVAISVSPVSGVFQTRYATYLAISSGNVGIGTTSPSYKLHVNGSLNATTIYQNGSTLDSLLGAKLNSSSYTAADVLAKLKTVDGSGSGLDADTLDGTDKSGLSSYMLGYHTDGKILEANTDLNNVGAGFWGTMDNTAYTNSPFNANFGIISMTLNGTYLGQLALPYTPEHNIRYRNQYYANGRVWSGWKTLAFTTDNVASATKLQTPRTIWGQSFDGTGNVSGDLNGVGRIIRTEPTAVDMDWAGNFIFKNPNSVASNYWHIDTSDGTPIFVVHNNGNVGIGTTSPSHKLHVEGSIYSSGYITSYYFQAGDSSYNNGTIELSGSTPFIDFHYDNSTADYTNRLIEGLSGQLTCTGKFRIGLNYTTSTDYNFYVSGSAYISSNLLTGGGITMYSARVLKNVIDEDGLSLRELSVIKPTRYTWKDKRDERLHIGGIADDIQQVLPEVVYRTPDGVLTMDYGNAAFAIASSLIKPMIEHESEIVSLKRKVRELEEEVKRLRA